MNEKKNNKRSSVVRDMMPMLSASSVGIVFVLSIVIGVLIGVWLDKKFNTKPWLTLFFMFMGIASGVKNAWYFIKKAERLSELEEKENKNNGDKDV